MTDIRETNPELVEATRQGIVLGTLFEDMATRQADLEEQIKAERLSIKAAYAKVAALREELKTVKRLLGAAKPRTRTSKKGKAPT